MKLWVISGTACGWDTYSEAVVAAETKELACATYPDTLDVPPWGDRTARHWARSPDDVTAEYIGEAAPGVKAGVVVASYHQG